MRGEYRKIDCNLGLDELADSFQLRFVREQTEYIRDNLDTLVANTIKNAPYRKKGFRLDRRPESQVKHKAGKELTREEDKWERAIYEKWGPAGFGEFVSVCKRIQTYQYPLQASCKDRWGKIDLLGIDTEFLPVPIELKKREANESPLRMLVEVAAYGFAIQKVWPNLKDCWVKAVRWFGVSPSQFSATLDRVTLVGVAPEEYWRQWRGLSGTEEGKFPCEAWPPFWELVDRFGKWFDIHFVAVEGSCDKTAKRATIAGARILGLRSLTAKPPTDTPNSTQ